MLIGLSSFLLLLFFAKLESQETFDNGRSDRQCDIGFVLDTSGSIHKDEYKKQKTFVSHVAKHIGIGRNGPHYGVILFSQFANVEIKFNEYFTIDSFEKAVMKLKQPGSVTRIDRGLKKAYNILFTEGGGSRKDAEKILFLLTDGSQTEGEDVVENSYLANNLRFIGVNFYVIGIGRKVAPDQLLKIAGSTQHLYFVKSFEELKSDRFVHQFNISCGAGRQHSKMFYLKVIITNKLSVPAEGGIEKMNGMKEPFLLKPSESKYFQHKLRAENLPYIKVFASSELYGDMLTTEQSKHLTVNYGKIGDEYTITLEKIGMSLQKLYQVYYSVINQLKTDIIVSCMTKHKKYELLVRGYHMKRDQLIKVFTAEDSVTFVARYLNGDPVKINGKYSVTIMFHQGTQVAYKILYTEKEKRNTYKPKLYSFRYKIVNVGRRNVLIYQGNGVTYELRAGAGEMKRFSGKFLKQPGPIELSTSFPGETENRKHIKYLLPRIGGSYETIFIGNDFEVSRPYCFTISVNNLASGLVTIEWKLIKADLVMHFPKGIAHHQVQFSFMENIPAKQAKAFIYGLGKRKKLLVNNKAYDLISPERRNDVVKIILSENKATKKHFFAVATNRLMNDVVLYWKAPPSSIVVKPIPKNNITILGMSKRNVNLRFRSFFPINNLELRAKDKTSGLGILINGRNVLVTKAVTFKKLKKMSLVFGYPEILLPVQDLVVVESSKSSLSIRWKQVVLANGYVITVQAVNSSNVLLFNYTHPYNAKKRDVLYKVSGLKSKTKYTLSVRTNQPSSKYASIIGRTLSDDNEYSISLRIKNQWSYAVLVKIFMIYDNINSNMIADDEVENYITVEGYADVNHTIDVPLAYHQADFKVQLFEKETGLMLMLPDKQEYFTVSPQNYKQPYLIQIENDDKVSLFKPYYFNFRFANFAENDALVYLRNISGGLIMKKSVRLGDTTDKFETIVQYEICPLYHYMEARVNGDVASINGMSKMKVIPTVQKIEIPIHISVSEDAESLPKTYFVDVTVKNQWKNPVICIWPLGLTINRMVTPAEGTKRKTFTMASDYTPQDLLFKFADKVTGRAIKVDDMMSVFLKYNQILQPVVFIIDSNGNGHVHFSYYLILQVNNFHTEKASVRWNNEVLLEVDAQESKLHKVLMHRSSDPVGIIFEALTCDDEQLFINNQKEILAVPSVVQEVFAFNITDGTDSGLKFKVSVINMLDNEVRVTFDGGLVRKEVNVDYKMMKQFDIKSPSPLTFKISAQDVDTGEMVNVNGSSNIVIDPSRRKQDVFVLFIGATEEQLESSVRPFYFYVVFKNYNPKDITVKWNEPSDSGKQLINIPAGQQRIRRNIFISKEQPKRVTFKFETSKSHRLLLNNKIIQVQPSPVFKQTEIVMDADATTMFYFMNLVIINTLPYATNLKLKSSTFDGNTPIIPISASSFTEQQMKVNSSTGDLAPILITAGKNGDIEYINGVKTGIKVELSREQNITRLYIGYEGKEEDVPSLKVLFIKLRIQNNRSSPVSISSEGLEDIVVLNKTGLKNETIMVGRDVPSELLLTISDLYSGKILIFNGKGSLTMKRRKIKDNLFSISLNLGLSEDNEEKAIYVAVIRLSITNYVRKTVKISCQINNITKVFTIRPRSKQNIQMVMPVYNPESNMVVKAMGEVINGKKEIIIPLSSKKVFTNLVIGNKDENKRIEMVIHNTLAESINVKWDAKNQTFSQIVPARSRINILLFVVGFDVTSSNLVVTAQETKNLYLNGVKRSSIPLNSLESLGKTIVVTGSSDKRNIMVILDLHNQEEYPIIVRRSFGITINNILSDFKLAPNEKRRVYMNFPRYVTSIIIRAYSLVKNKLMVINGKFALTISPDDCGCIVKGIIRKYGGPVKLKYELDVNNQASSNITVFWVVNGTKYDNVVPAGDHVLICGTFGRYDAPDSIKFRARNGEKKLLFGGKDAFSVKPTVESKTIFITITEKGPQQQQMKDYVLVLYFINKVEKDVNLIWDIENKETKGYITPILAGEKKLLEIQLRRNSTPDAIIFTGSKSEGSDKVKLNGRFQIRFQPGVNRRTIEVFIDPKERPVTINFLNIKFFIDYPLAVDIEWTINKVRRLLTLQKNTTFSMKDVIRVIDNKTDLISFHAWDVTRKCNLLMNDRILFKITPSRNPKANTTVVVRADATIDLYKLVITNDNLGDVTLVSNIFQKKNGNPVKSSELFTEVIPGKTINLTRTQSIDTPRLFVNVVAYDIRTKKVRYINDQLSIKLSPTETNIIIIGDIVRERPYLFKLRVTNLVPSYVALNYSLNGKITKNYIPPYTFNYITMGQIKTNVTPKAILFNSFLVTRKSKLLTNDLPFFPVTPVLRKNLKTIQVYLSFNKTTKNLTLYFKNPTVNPITIKWKTTNFKGEKLIPKQSSKFPVLITTNGGYRKQKVFVEPVSDDYGDIVVNLNANFTTRIPYEKEIVVDYIYKNITIRNLLPDEVMVNIAKTGFNQKIAGLAEVSKRIPGNNVTKEGLELTAMKVSDNKSVLICGKMTCKLSLGDMLRVIEIGNKKIQKEKFFLKLWISNNHNGRVILRFKKDDKKQIYLIPNNYNKIITLAFKTNSSLLLTAVDKVTKKPVYLNRRAMLECFPRQNNRYAKTIVISGEIYLYDYFYRLLVNNYARQTIRIQLVNGKDKREAIVPADSLNYSINTPLSNLELGPKQLMKALSFSNETYDPLYINGGESVDVYPTLDDEDATIINVDGTKLPFKLYFYSMLVTVPQYIDVILKYTLDGEAKISRIPKASVAFSVTIPFHSFTTPPNITIRAFNERNNAKLLVNGDLEDDITPNLGKEYKQPVVVTTRVMAAGDISESLDYGDWLVYRTRVNNPNSFKVRLKGTYNGRSYFVSLPAKKRLFRLDFNTSTMKAPNERAGVLMVNAESKYKRPLKINGSDTALINDRPEEEGITILNIELLLLAEVSFINNLTNNVTLKYQTENRAGEIVIPKTGKTMKVLVGERIKFVPISQDILMNNISDLTILPTKVSKYTIILSKQYQLTVTVITQLNTPANLNWISIRNGSRSITSNQTFTINETKKPEVITFSALDKNNRVLLVNNKTSFVMTPGQLTEKIILTLTKQQVKYYYNIMVNNNLPIPVQINCTYNNTLRIIKLESNEMNKKFEFPTQSKEVPEVMTCKSVTIDPGIKPMLNKKSDTVDVNPNTDIQEYKKIDITFPTDAYYISLKIRNLVDTNVTLQWNGTQRNGIKVIPSKATNKSVVIMFKDKRDIKVVAMDRKGTGLLVNSRRIMKATSTTDKKRTIYVEISQLNKDKYYLSINVVKDIDVPIKLNCSYNDTTKIFELAASDTRKKFQLVVEDARTPDTMNCTAAEIEPGIKPLLNEKLILPVTPKKNSTDFNTVNITLPDDTYYINLVVTNLIVGDANLKWNGTKRNGMNIIPMKAKNKTLTILFMKETDINLLATDSAEKSLLVNLKDVMMVTTSRDRLAPIYVEISRKKIYFSIIVSNNNSVPVKLNCSYGNQFKIYEVQTNEMKKKFQVVVEKEEAPVLMNCTSPITEPGKEPLLNGKTSVVVNPNENSTDYGPIDVTYAEEIHYIRMLVTNLVDSDVSLEWSSSKQSGVEAIPENAENKTVMLSFKGRIVVKLLATDSTGMKFFVNMKESMQATSLSDKEKTIYVEISKSQDNYFYSIAVDSKLSVPVKLICVYNNSQKTIEVKENEINKKIQISIQSDEAPDTMNCTPSSIEPGIKPDLNGKKFVAVTARKDANKFTKIVVTYPDGLHYIRLLITNLIDSDVNLKWNSTSRKDTLMIANGTSNRNYVIVFFKKADITIIASGKRDFKLFVNAKDSEQATSSVDQQRSTYIEITTGELYYSFIAENAELYDATVNWIFLLKKRSLQVEGLKSKDLSIRAKNTLDALELTAYRDWRKKTMYLNNNYTFYVYPQRTEFPYTYILLSMAQRSLIKYMYISLSVTNLVKSDVTLLIGNQSRIIKIKAKDFKILIPFDKSKMDSPTLGVRGYVVNSKNEVFINSKRSVNVLLQKSKEPSRSLILTDFASQQTIYYVQVEVQNNHHKDVIIKYREGGVLGTFQEIYTSSAYHSWFDVVFVKKSSRPITAEFMAFDASSDRKLYVSGKVSIIYRPQHQNGTLVLSIGEAVPKRKLDPSLPEDHKVQRFFGFHITNDGKKSVDVSWEENGKKMMISIPAKKSREYTTLIDVNPNNPYIYLKATDAKLSGRSVVYIRPNKAKKIIFLHVNSEEDHSYRHRYYYYGMKIDNRAKYDVFLRWKEINSSKELLVKSHSIQDFHSIIRGKTKPNDIIIRGFRADTDERVLMNDRARISIMLSRQSTRMYILIKGEESDLSLKFYWGIDVKNLLRMSVILYWMESGEKKSLTVKGYGSQHYDAVITSKTQPASINITAASEKTSELVKIYDQYYHLITPVRERGRTVLVIGKLGDGRVAPRLYNLTVQVMNDDKRLLILRWHEDGTKKEISVDGGSFKIRDISILSKTQPDPIMFQVIDPNSTKFGTINGKTFYTAQPRLEGRFLHIYISGEPEKKDKGTICKTKMDLAFLLDGSGTMKQVYPYAKAFIMMLAEEFHLSPNHTHIGIIVFSETALLEIPFNRHQEHDAFQKDVDNLSFVGYRTHLNIAFNEANEHLFDEKYGSRNDARKVLIVLTDGRHNSADNSDEEMIKAQQASIPLLNKNVTIVVIGLFGSVAADQETLSHIAGNKKENVFMVAHSPDLLSRNFLDGLVYKYCNTKHIRAKPLGTQIKVP